MNKIFSVRFTDLVENRTLIVAALAIDVLALVSVAYAPAVEYGGFV